MPICFASQQVVCLRIVSVVLLFSTARPVRFHAEQLYSAIVGRQWLNLHTGLLASANLPNQLQIPHRIKYCVCPKLLVQELAVHHLIAQLLISRPAVLHLHPVWFFPELGGLFAALAGWSALLPEYLPVLHGLLSVSDHVFQQRS